jgi:TolB-like protein/class 3 adenylate cyclase/cytochrome c-type biogenesis protein CcmH/NrfG
MAKDDLTSKLAVILHADVAGSTALVHQNEQLAHQRIQDTFHRFGNTISKYHGHVRELRGDALLAEFERASDAVSAALAFQAGQSDCNTQLNDNIQPTVRVGIALGEVVIADNTVTGAGVVLAQRVEQLADAGGVCITAALHEAIPRRMPFDLEDMGEQILKGFDDPVHVYRVELSQGESIPVPAQEYKPGILAKSGRLKISIAVVLVAVMAGTVYWLLPSGAMEEPASVERMAFPLPDKPSIAVLPFTNMSGDVEQEYFADGMTEDLITDLSKISGLFVIARNSSFSYKGQQVKVRQVAEDMGVRYVLEGSVRRAGNQVRINAQLIDATTGGHLWAERYDGTLADIFSLQDQVTREIVTALSVTLTPEERDSSSLLGTSNIEAHDAYLQGLSFYIRNSPTDNAKAELLFQRAIDLDPEFGRAYEALAKVYFNGTEKTYASAMGFSSRKAAYFAYTTLARSPGSTDRELHAILARASLLKHQLETALHHADLALAISPNDIDMLKIKALALIFSGQHGAGRLLADRIIRLDPALLAEPMYIYGLSHFAAGTYDEAARYLEWALQNDPSNSTYHRLLAATYGVLGRQEEAREALRIYRKSWRQYWIAAAVYAYPFKDERNLQALADGFETAGLVERPPARYLKLNGETRLTGAEIDALLTGRTIKGTDYWRAYTWTLHRSRDGILKQTGGTFFFSVETDGLRGLDIESWIEPNRLCHRGTGVNDEITFCVTIHHDSVRGEGHYYMVTDTGPHPFQVLNE